jgi:hypothetical protein
MNDTSRVNYNSEPDDEGLDPAIVQLFDEAPGPAGRDEFITSTMLEMQASRRARLLRRRAIVVVILVVGALIAPYAARVTLMAASWLAERLPSAGLVAFSPVAWACATLITWRIARRAS